MTLPNQLAQSAGNMNSGKITGARPAIEKYTHKCWTDLWERLNLPILYGEKSVGFLSDGDDWAMKIGRSCTGDDTDQMIRLWLLLSKCVFYIRIVSRAEPKEIKHACLFFFKILTFCNSYVFILRPFLFPYFLKGGGESLF